jgi:hypothetical protein
MDVDQEDPRELRYARDLLMSVYIELSMPSGSDEEAQMALSAARVATPAMLRGLAEDVSDPWPWALFLRRILTLPDSEEARDAFQKLYDVAQTMLDEQGLELVHPEDLLAEGPLERRLRPYMTSPI